MTIGNDTIGTTSRGGGEPAPGRSSPTPADTIETGKAEASEVATTVKEGGKDVLDEVTAKTAEVATTAKDEVHRLLDQASTEVKNVSRDRGQQLAGKLESLAQQMRALREGRADEAGDLRSWMTQAEQRMQHYAAALRQRGPEGVLEDVRGFARRRPGMFLLAAGISGFAIGRAVRAGAMSSPGSNGERMTDYQSNGSITSSRGQRDLTSPVEYGNASVDVAPMETLPPPAAGTTAGRQNP